MTTSWIVTSGGPAPEIPELTLPEFLLAGRDPDRPAIVDGPSGRGMTYGELAARVRRVAAGSPRAACARATPSRCSPRTCPSGCSPPTA